MMLKRLVLISLIALAGHQLLWAKDKAASEDTPINGKALNDAKPLNESPEVEEDINGLVIDHTVTFIGRDFYTYFARYWSDQGLMDHYNLIVQEQPTARFGSRIRVEWNRKIVFQTFLPPTRANIETSAKAAAQSIAQRFRMMEIQKFLFIDPDLAPDEF